MGTDACSERDEELVQLGKRKVAASESKLSAALSEPLRTGNDT